MHDSDNRGPGRGAADPVHTNRGTLNILRGTGFRALFKIILEGENIL